MHTFLGVHETTNELEMVIRGGGGGSRPRVKCRIRDR